MAMMNRRFFLNVIIISISAFLLIFTLLNRQLLQQAPELNESDLTLWGAQMPIRFEFPSRLWLLRDQQWASDRELDSERLQQAVLNWRQLRLDRSRPASVIPDDAYLLLVYLEGQPQPQVFKYFTSNSGAQWHLVRLLDNREWLLDPSQAQALLLLPDQASHNEEARLQPGDRVQRFALCQTSSPVSA